MTLEEVRTLVKAVFFDPPWVAAQDGGFNIGNRYYITPMEHSGLFKLERADYIGPPLEDRHRGIDYGPDDFEMQFIANDASVHKLLVKMAQDLAKWRMADEIKYRLGVKVV